MPRLLALEWSETEARFAVASSHGDQVTVEQAFSANMRPGEPGVEPGPRDVGTRIAAALAEHRVGKIDTLVAIGRANIELRQLTVPPVPDEELADIVRFTALREFNALEENWPLDFLPIDDAPDQPRTVLAAAISPEMVEQIQRTCHSAGLKPRRLILRPCGAASLLCRQQVEGRPRARLLVDLLGDEADLTVMIDRKVIFLRTARLPGDPLIDAEAVQALLAELRRTMAAVQNQLGGRKVEAIVLCGTGQPHAALAELIDSRLATPTEVFDPFAGLALGGDLARALPEHPSRFAPLLGMLLDELHQSPHGVDFLHPRRRPAPPSRRRLFIGAGVGAAVVVLVCLLVGWLVSRHAEGRRLELQAKLDEYDRQLGELTKDGLTKDEDTLKKIDAWKAGGHVWLEEFRWFVKKLPESRETMLDGLTMGVLQRGPEISFQGFARALDTFDKLEKPFREGKRQVDSKDRVVEKKQSGYTYHYTTSILIPREARP
jgi:Tfp pilus assembly PilM family ATPase